MKRLLLFCCVLALLFSFAIMQAYGSNEWDKYTSIINANKTNKYVPNATIPSTPPKTAEQFKALRYHKTLLQRELKKIRKDEAKEVSTAAIQGLICHEESIEKSIKKIDNLLKGKR